MANKYVPARNKSAIATSIGSEKPCRCTEVSNDEFSCSANPHRATAGSREAEVGLTQFNCFVIVTNL